MDFGLSEEQRALADSVRRFAGESLPVATVREIAARESGHDPERWRGLAELGAAGMLVPEEHGGAGLALLDAAVVAEELGRAVAPLPFLGTSLMAVLVLRESGSAAQRAAWLPDIAQGRRCLGVAFGELVSLRGDAGVREQDGRLRGRALFTIDAGAADAFLVAVGASRIALVERGAPGLAITPLTTIDRTRRLAELAFDDVDAFDWVGGSAGAPGTAARAIVAARIALAADLLGAAERCLERAVAYALQREQFGRPIGSFQAVKHLCAEMAAEIEPARSLLWYAAHAFDAAPDDAPRLAAHAKAHLAEVGTFVARTATEVHGGIGFTDEHDLHLWFKRIGLDRQLLGGPDALRARAAALEGWAEPGGLI